MCHLDHTAAQSQANRRTVLQGSLARVLVLVGLLNRSDLAAKNSTKVPNLRGDQVTNAHGKVKFTAREPGEHPPGLIPRGTRGRRPMPDQVPGELCCRPPGSAK